MCYCDPCRSELSQKPAVLVRALPSDPAEYRRLGSTVLAPKPRTRKMIGMISSRLSHLQASFRYGDFRRA